MTDDSPVPAELRSLIGSLTEAAEYAREAREASEESYEEKRDGSRVTEVDRRLDRFLRRTLEALGTERVRSEEHRAEGTRGEMRDGWIVDPIDGTHPFTEGRDGFAIQVARVGGGRPDRALACYPDFSDAVRLADAQSRVTGHDHPEGRFGARLQAAGVLAGLLRGTEYPPPRPAELVGKASAGWDSEDPAPDAFVRRMKWIEEHPGAPVDEAAARIGTGSRASRAVPAAIWAFLVHPDDPEEAVVTAVALGGDTDTIGAMTGALAGARNGASTIPTRWMEVVESGGEGREALTRLADGLHRRVAGES